MLTRRGAAALALLAVAACAGGAGRSGAPAPTTGPPVPPSEASTPVPTLPTNSAPTQPDPALADRVRAQLAGLSLEQEVGQVFAPYVFGRTADDRRPAIVAANRALLGVETGAQAVARWHLGAILLLDHNPLDAARPQESTGNVDSPATVARLTTGLQGAAAAAGDPPLLVAVDQEGGPVARLGAPFAVLAAQMALGAAGDAGPALAGRAARVTGEELRSVGVTLDLAPVADVNTEPRNPVIGERAFGDDPARVSPLVAAAVRGYTAAGTGSALKHFPGHGDSDVDSHLGLPTIRRTRGELERIDLAPFRAGIAAGAPAVLLGHLLVPALDPVLPATVSPAVLHVLRQELGFDGVAVTDGLFMRALRDRYPDDDVAVRALTAGMDLLLQPPSLPTSYAAVLAAVHDGRLPRSRLDDAVRRVLTLKARFPAPAATAPVLSADAPGLIRDVAAASISVVRDCRHRLPAAALAVLGSGATADALRADVAARGALRAGGVSVAVGPAPSGADVLVATGAPYPLGLAPPQATTVAAFSPTPGQLLALADVLTGRAPARGLLPVALALRRC